MFKYGPSICYIFYAIDDVTVTSVNTYMSMMGISIFFTRNKKYGAKRLLKCLLTKTEVLVD